MLILVGWLIMKEGTMNEDLLSVWRAGNGEETPFGTSRAYLADV